MLAMDVKIYPIDLSFGTEIVKFVRYISGFVTAITIKTGLDCIKI